MDKLGKPTVHIDEFHETDACDDGIARLLEGRERQEEFTFQDILEGHNNADDICWFILAMADDEFNIDSNDLIPLILEYVARHPTLSTGIVGSRARTAVEEYAGDGVVRSMHRSLVVYCVTTSGRVPAGLYKSEVHELLNYINNNWKTRR